MAATEAGKKVSLKLVVNKERDKVLFAEAGKDFVDIMFSFLTLPLGTIARLVGKESNLQAVDVGCLSSLNDSVVNLDKGCFWTDACKEMLLQPRSSMELYCRNLKVKIDDTEPIKYFYCHYCNCAGAFRNRECSCPCTGFLNTEMSLDYSNINNGFAFETATFIICDDLHLMPNVLEKSLALLQNLGIEDMGAIEERIVNISEKEVLDLLKCSLFSVTPLTYTLLKKVDVVDDFNERNLSQVVIKELPSKEDRKMVVKVLVRKSNGKILLAQAEEDFADFILSFLTLPLGGVLHMLEGCSSLICIDNLYKSLASLSSDRYFISQEIKDNLANPQCAYQFKISDQILPIGEASAKYIPNRYRVANPRSSTGETSTTRGFAKGPAMYMVTDDLVVTPLSSGSCFSYLNGLKVPLGDFEERVINIGLTEGLSILKASLISKSALTNGLHHILTTIKKEK